MVSVSLACANWREWVRVAAFLQGTLLGSIGPATAQVMMPWQPAAADQARALLEHEHYMVSARQLLGVDCALKFTESVYPVAVGAAQEVTVFGHDVDGRNIVDETSVAEMAAALACNDVPLEELDEIPPYVCVFADPGLLRIAWRLFCQHKEMNHDEPLWLSQEAWASVLKSYHRAAPGPLLDDQTKVFVMFVQWMLQDLVLSELESGHLVGAEYYVDSNSGWNTVQHAFLHAAAAASDRWVV